MQDNYVLGLSVLVPFAGAFVLAFVPANRSDLIRIFAVALASLCFALSLYIFLSYDHALGGHQLRQEHVWVESLGISFKLGVDGVSAVLILLNGIVLLASVIVSWNLQTRNKEFFILLFLLVTGVYGIFETIDLFFLFFFYELAVVPMYLLIGVWGSSTDFGSFARTKEYGAMKLVLYLTAGSMLVWIALLAIYAQANLGTFDLESLQTVEFPVVFQQIFFPILVVGFGVLAGLWPFHTWSPDGHVAAPTAVSMLHAGVLMKVGAYPILSVAITLFPEGAQDWAPVLMGLATINVLYGAIAAISQHDLKYVVAYSSVSHMGYVLMGLATLEPIGVSGAVLQMFSHGIMTALFFALVGVIYEQTHIRDITVLEGLSKRMGVTGIFFTVAALTSLGLPGFSGFVAEFLVFVGTFRTYPFLGFLAILGAAITAVYMLRLLSKVFFGPLPSQWEGLSDASRHEKWAMASLVLVLIGVGVWPFPLIRLIDSSVNVVLAGMGG